MPFADFLATVGEGQQAGRVGEYFGGKSPGQRRADMFINQELPRLAQEIERANNRQDIEKSARGLLTSGLQAGLNPQALDKLMDMVVQPALRNVQGQELEGIRRDYGARPAESRPEGTEGPLTQEGNFIDPRAERPLDQAGALRVFQATGASPQHFQSILETPSKVTENLAQARGHAATGAQKEYELGQQRRLENIPLPGSAGEAGMTAGMLATPHAAPLGSYMTGLNPQRERPADPLEDVKRRHLEALTERATRGPAEPRRKLVTRDLGDRVETFDPETGEITHVAQKGAVATTSEREGQLSQVDTEVALNAIRDEAVRTGKTGPEDLKRLAAKRGLILEGMPGIESSGGIPILGWGAEKSLSGPDVRLRRAPTTSTTTKGPAGQAPSGQPSPSAKASGGAPAAPKPGTVIQGFRFKGGDPANQANWEQVR